MTTWINRSVVQAPRNGTDTHSVTFTAAAAGSLLVAVVEGAVTSSTPTGWTQQLAAVNYTGLYVWTKTADGGESTLTTTHNSSNYPVAFVIYEFPAGSTWVDGDQATNTGLGDSGWQTLSGLSGTNLVMGALAAVPDAATTNVTWEAGATEDLDLNVPADGTDGYLLSIGYAADYSSASWEAEGTVTDNDSTPPERVVYALQVAAASGTAYTATPADTATATDSLSATLTEGGTALTASPADTVTVSDALTADLARSLTVTLADTVTVSDTGADYSLVITFDADLSDAATASDTLTATLARALTASPTDTAAITDEITASLARKLTATLADDLAATDSLAVTADATRNITDTATVTDSLTASLVSAGSVSLTDAAGIADSITASLTIGARALVATLADTISAADNLTARNPSAVHIDITVTAADTRIRTLVTAAPTRADGITAGPTRADEVTAAATRTDWSAGPTRLQRGP